MGITTVTAAALLAAALLAGCGGSDQDGKPAPATPSNTWPGGMSPEPDTTTAEPEPTVEVLAFREEWPWESTDVDGGESTGRTTVLGYQQPVRSIAVASEEVSQKGYVWGALELKVCADTGSILVSSFDWILAYEDGARVEPSSSTWDDFPKPEFPTETEVRAGDCVRGKIVYPVPGDQRPERALYAPPLIEDAVEWTIPAK